jgi:glycosyltransferase involved in cell wall biosynthesis
MRLATTQIAHAPTGNGQTFAGVDQPCRAPHRQPPMRVMLIVESSGAGTGRHVLDLAEGLSQRRCQVHVLYSTLRLDRLFADRLAALKSVHSAVIDMKTAPHPSDVGVVRFVRRYLKEFGPFNIIHGHSSKGGAIARLAALCTNIPAFYTLHGLIMMDPTLPRWKWALYLAIERLLELRTARIIAVSPEEQRAAIGLGFGKSRVVIIPNGISDWKLASRADARAEMGVRPDELVIGFVGRLVEQKAPEVLIEAFGRTLTRVPNVRLALVGDGPLGKPLRELAKRLNVQDKVLWLGERDSRGVLAGFDLFALPSRKEGLPYVVLEAMYAGLPLVVTSSAGCEILVRPHKNGLIIPTDDAEAMSDALSRLLSDPSRLGNCAEMSRNYVQGFSVDTMVESTLKEYENCRSIRQTA